MESIETQVDPVGPKGYIRPEGASVKNLSKVHGWLSKHNKGFKVGFDEFLEDMSDEANLVKTFDYLKKQNPDFKVDYDAFAQDMGFELKKKDLPQFGEDGSPENSAPLPVSSTEKPLTTSVPQPSELEQLLSPEVAPNDLEQALASAQQPPPPQTDFGSQSIDAIDEQLRQEIKQAEEGEAPKIPDDAIEKAKKRNKSFESALNIQFEKQFEPELKKAQKQFEAEQKDKVKEIQSLVDKGSISVEKGNELLNKWQDKKQDELNESLTKQQEIKYDQFLEENKDFISKWQDIYQTQFDKDAAKPDLSFSPEKKVVGSDKPTPKQKLSRDELLANQFEVKKDRIKKLIKEEDKAKYASKIKEVSKNLSSKIDEQLKKMPKDISFEDVGVGTPKVKTDEKRDVLRMAKDILKEIEDTPDQGGFLEGLSSKGLVHSLPFISSVAEFPELSVLKKAAEEGVKVGEKMGPNEMVLTANDLRNKFNQAKENPSAYRWGQVLADMVPYIVEYATTAGVYTTARAATTTALTNAIKASAKPIIKNAIIKPVSTLVGIAAQTAANPQRFIDTAVRRMTPQLQITLSEDGNEIDKYIAKPGEDFKTAFAKSFGVNALELLTERFGQWSNEAAPAMKISGSWMPNIILAKWMEKKGITTLAEAQKQARRIGWDGVFQEIWIEEYPNKILQNAVTGDEQWNPDFFNPLSQEFVDMIVPSLFLSGGPVAMAAVNKWASKGVPEDKAKANLEALKNAYKRPEQDISVPKGDLGKKPATDEKPKEQPKEAGPAAEPAKPEVKKEEALPVQKEEPKIKEEINNFADRIINGEKLTSKEDLQFYENNKTDIESYINAKKQQEDAVQERSTEKVPVDEAPGGSQEVGEGVSKPKEPAITQTEEQSPDSPQEEVVRKISDAIGKEKLDKRAIEKIGKEAGIDNKNEIKELGELAVVQKARALAKNDDFEGLVQLYNDQPNLSHRTNESISKQQYSTPAPIAYMMGKYIGADKPNTKTFEPSAGNGMLTIVGDPKSYTVNEIDGVRLRNLETQGFNEILSQDGSQEFARPKQYDAVITNPPFGGTNAVNVEGYKLNELAQIMAVRALDTMKDNGKGAIIIGGNSEFSPEGQLKGRDRIFFNYLFNKYNVDDVIDVSGDLYRKQGASFPIRVILINGRKAEAKGAAPTSEWFGEQAESFDDVKNRIDGFLTQQSNETLQSEELVGGPTDIIRDGGPREGEQAGSKTDDSVPGAQIQEDGGRGIGGQRDVEASESVRSGDVGNSGTESGRGVDSGSDIVERPVSNEAMGEGRTERQEQQQPGGVEEVLKPRARSDRKIAEGGIGASTVQYQPLSGGKSFDLMSPAGMRQEILDAQTDLENDVGDIDLFVMDRLKYKSKEEMYKALGAEQIDGVALAIRNIERGTGIIIGDQTGVGKGRQAAAIIRYGNMQGLSPIFLTEKPNLFTDLYRDLDGIGYGDIKPFIVNSTGEKFKGVYRGKEVVYKAPSQSDKDHKMMLKIGQIPNDAKVILATYSQFSSERYVDKINFLKAMSHNNIIILDESHNASGQGNTSTLFQQLLPETKGVVYLSGTFAKRADNMPVYALKTSMQEANMTTTELITAIEGGGVALQEIISSQLAESGEMVRRERTFKGIEVNNHIIGSDNEEISKRQLQQADQVTSVMNDIIKFQTDHIKPVIAGLNGDAIREGERVVGREGTNMAGVDNTPYFSKVFNVINQLLYSIKAKDTAQMAVEMLKKGEKPFIAIRSTMEAMLKDIIERGDLKVGDAIEPDFRFVLKKGLEGVMRISVKDAYGNSKKEDIPLTSLPMQSMLEYKRIMSKISSTQTGLTISPIDEVVQLIEKAGYKVGEVTGRKTKLDFKGGKGVINNNKKQPVNELYRKYNSGEIDVLVVNSSGSTGASAHASAEVKDQRQRHMLILEPELNISTLVQILGRINRTGQIKLPKYTFVGSNIPAEQRLMMMTMRKLKSLDANTTSNQKQSKSFLEVPEIFNKYGDQVVVEYLMENPEIIESLGDPLKMLTTGNEVVEPGDTIGAANKVTGRVAILPTGKQAEFYAEITDRYNTTLQFLNDAGLNDLEVRQLPLKAKTISKNLSKMGKGGISRFGEDTFLEEVEADVLKKPMTKSEVDKSIADLGTNTNEELKGQLEAYKESVIADINTVEDERLANKIAKAKEDVTLDEEAKAQLIQELEENSQVTKEYKANKEAEQIKYVDTLFTFFQPGRAVKVPIDFEIGDTSFSVSDGIFLGFDINQKKKKPFIRSNVILKFAVNDSRRFISIPSSKMNIINEIRVNSYSLSESHQEHVNSKWDELKKPKARGKRYIVTGNVLQGLSDSNFRKGRIVKYSTDEGFINTGILLSESFDPTKIESSKTVSVPAGKAAKVIIDSDTGKSFNSSDGLWTINKKTNNKYSLRVPKSKQTGGKYYLNEDINELVDHGRWDSVGNEMEAFTDSSRIDQLLTTLGNQYSTSFDIDKTLFDKTVEMSKRSSGQYVKPAIMPGTFLPISIFGKVKRIKNDNALLSLIKKNNKTEEQKLEEELTEALKFKNSKNEKRYKDANIHIETEKPTFIDKVKEVGHNLSSPYRFLKEKDYPREASLLRETKGARKFAIGQANIYVKGLHDPLTPKQAIVLHRTIVLSDLISSIEKGLNMQDINGKYPFEFESKKEINDELKRFREFMEADPIIQNAFEQRQSYQQWLERALSDNGIISEQEDKLAYYHRRSVATMDDQYHNDIISGAKLGSTKKRNWQRKRIGSAGKDYNTNFIDVEHKVVAEGIYALRMQELFRKLVAPHEAKLKALKLKFNQENQDIIDSLESEYGKDSPEVEIRKSNRSQLLKNYLAANIPEGYKFWQPDSGNKLFWVKSASEKMLQDALSGAKLQDSSGVAASFDIIDGLISSMDKRLAVGAKRHQYMIPTQLADELDEMGRYNRPNELLKLSNDVVGEWQKVTLLGFPFIGVYRAFRYNINSAMSDIDRTFEVDRKIFNHLPRAIEELWRYSQYGEVTVNMERALKGDVIGSGHSVTEFKSLSKEQWARYFSNEQGPDLRDIMGKKWLEETGQAVLMKPREWYDIYMDSIGKYTSLREDALRYAAFLRLNELREKGEMVYWATPKDVVEGLKNDPELLQARLARDVYVDYNNLPFLASEARKTKIAPFIAWAVGNFTTTINLIKNASDPKVQKAMYARGAAMGMSKIAIRSAMAWSSLLFFTAAVQLWNHFLFPRLPWLDDDDDDAWKAAEKLRATNFKGMQLLLYTKDGIPQGIPLQGALYDFLDWFGVPDVADDIVSLITATDFSKTETAKGIAPKIGKNFINKAYQMVTPLVKVPVELSLGETTYPDIFNAQPMMDRGEYLANLITLRDEYNYFLTDKPKKESFFDRKIKSLFLREFDIEQMSYYAAKHIIKERKGGYDYTPGSDSKGKAISKAAYYYSLAKRFGQEEEAKKYFKEFIDLSKSSDKELTDNQALKKMLGIGQNPFKNLNTLELIDLKKSFADKDHIKTTDFVKGLTEKELGIFKDAAHYYLRISGKPLTDYNWILIK